MAFHLVSTMGNGTDIVYLIPPGKIKCCVTGYLRDDTPEENVRQRWARSLMEEYGFPKTDLGVEVRIAMGRERKRADIAVYRHGAERVQENITVLVEAKRDDVLTSDRDKGIEQLKSYMAACV